MKSKDDIRPLAEKKYPYNPYNDTLFPCVRQAHLEGFVNGYLEGSCSEDNLRKAFEAGKSNQSFEDFLKTLFSI
jgi:hypothetical protein